MRSDLFDQSNLENQSGERMVLQNAHMLKVTVSPEQPVLALKGSMVAFQGEVEFHHKSAGSLGKLIRKALTSEDTPLMTVSGRGEVFFADLAKDVFVLDLDDEAVSVNGTSILAFDGHLDHDVHRVKGAGSLSGGMFNTKITGTGRVALTSDGKPVVLDCATPTYVDVQAAVCWSANLSPTIRSSVNMRSLLRGGTGEAFQYAFHGPGFVVVQPSEKTGEVPPHEHGNSGGGLGGMFD